MLEILTGGLVTLPSSFLQMATAGYIDVSMLCQLQVYQTMFSSMFTDSVVGALSPQRLMFDEELHSFIYVSEMAVN